MLISNKLHSFRNFVAQKYAFNKRRAKKYLYICKKSVNSDFVYLRNQRKLFNINRIRWLHQKK